MSKSCCTLCGGGSGLDYTHRVRMDNAIHKQVHVVVTDGKMGKKMQFSSFRITCNLYYTAKLLYM